MNKRIKVLHLQPICNVRKADLQEEIIASLPIEQFEVVNAYLTQTPEQSGSGLRSQSERVHYFQFNKKELKGLRIFLMRQLFAFCQAEKFDVVMTHRFKAFDIMLKLNKWLKIPHCIAIIHCLGDFDRLYRKINSRLWLDKRWTIVSVSDQVKQELIDIGYGFNQNNVITINNAINTENLVPRLYPQNKARQQLLLKDDDFVFGTIGRAVKGKGYVYLIDAFYQLYQDNTHCHNKIKLVLIDEGQLKHTLQQQVKHYGLEEAVLFYGEIVDAKLLIPAFDVFVLSSLSEGFSLVVLEAMAAKKPLIATQVGIVPEIIKQSDEIIAPKNSEQLFSVMKKYYALSQKERQQLGETLWQQLIHSFDIKNYRKKYFKLVQKTNSWD
jgi:glycosyltransferase involved in cell wall biosynthesis